MQIESHSLERPRRRTGAPGVAGPHVLVQAHESDKAVRGEKGEEGTQVCEVRGVVDPARKKESGGRLGGTGGRVHTGLRVRLLPM